MPNETPEQAARRQAAAEMCIELLSEPSVYIRRTAVWELALHGGARAVDHLIPMLHSEVDWECRHYVVMALGRIGDARAVPALQALLVSDYLEPASEGPAGPAPPELAEHLRQDIEYALSWAEGRRAFHDTGD